MNPDPRLADGDVALRRYRRDDASRLAAIADNPAVGRFLADRFPYPYRLADAEEWLDLASAEVRVCNFAVEWNGELVGGAGLEPMGDVHAGTAGVGYWLGEGYWGRGLATRAVRLLTRYAFDELLFIRLQALVFVANAPSMRVLEKAGYVREGVMRAHVRKAGVVTDAVLYAKLRRESGGDDSAAR